MGVILTCRLNIWRLASVDLFNLSIEFWISSSDIALLMYTSCCRCIVRTMLRVGQSIIANCDYRKAKRAPDQVANYEEEA